MNLAMKLVLTVLIIAALVLGYLIYEKKKGVRVSNESSTSLVEDAPREMTPGIDEREMAVLRSFFSADASQEKKDEYFALVNKYAIATKSIDISDCVSSPFVAQISQGEKLSFINKGQEGVTIRINKAHSYEIAANSAKEIIADFGYGAGAHGFSCTTKDGISGIILIRE